MPGDLTGEDRCWPCTVANASVGLLIAWLPLGGALLEGKQVLVLIAVGWGILVTAFTLYRLQQRGYLPLADSVAKITGLHERIGPGAKSDSKEN